MDILVAGLAALIILAALALLALLRLRAVGSARPNRADRTENTVTPGDAQSTNPIETFREALVVFVKDGDTVDVIAGSEKLTIRLDSIDCPEDGQSWGDAARYGLIKLIGGRKVRLEVHGVDTYGRTLATIYVRSPNDGEWMNVNERMVVVGHAWVYHQYYEHLPPDRRNKLDRLQQWARGKGVGLWREPNPTPPWLWRNGNKPQT